MDRGCLTGKPQEKLLDNSVILNPLSPDELFNKLRDMGHITGWGELLTKASNPFELNASRKNPYRVGSMLLGASFQEALRNLGFASSLYKSELREQNAIDFYDMIIRAIQEVNAGKIYSLNGDTYWLMSSRIYQQLEWNSFRPSLKMGAQPSLTVVGDDWQSIYRFNGGKLELTTPLVKSLVATRSLNYKRPSRYNNSIADTAGQFIMENPEQYKKYIETHTVVEDSQIYLLDDKSPKRRFE